MSDAPVAGAFRVDRDDARVTLTTPSGSVVVDARDHDLVVAVQGGRTLRFAASSAGLDDATEHVRAVVGDAWPSPALAEHLHAILRSAAHLRGIDVDAAVAAVFAVRRTPFVCSRGVIENAYLLRDVEKFRAAAAAVAFIEDLAVRDANVPEATCAWAHRLRDWRSLLVAPGSVARSVNRTLAEFGDDASPQALWGLRRVPLVAPLPSLQHVEVLGCLGARLPARDTVVIDPTLQQIVLAASPTELGEALVLLDEARAAAAAMRNEPPALALAEVLAGVPLNQLWALLDRRLRFADVMRVCIELLEGVLQDSEVAVIEPPIRLPRARNVSFLATIAAIIREGARMEHCVAIRAPRAFAGESYFFHVVHGGHEATAEVGKNGAVIEVKGPRNTINEAVRYAQTALTAWGARLAVHAGDPPSTSLWRAPAPPVPEGCVAVKTLAELDAALDALTDEAEPGDRAVWPWVKHAAAAARAGRTWLVTERAAAVTLMLWSLDADGNRIDSLEQARAHAAAAPLPVDVRGRRQADPPEPRRRPHPPLVAGGAVAVPPPPPAQAQHAMQRPWMTACGEDRRGVWATTTWNEVLFTFRWCPPGTFQQGSPSAEEGRSPHEGPQHEVELTRGFWLGATPVTRAQWEVVMANVPPRGDGAVDNVSFDDVRRYLERVNAALPGFDARLPTEAEWEYACRAATTAPTWLGLNDARLAGIAWYAANSGGIGGHDVGQKPSNPWGLHDMLGNVWEWCADFFAPYPDARVVDPTGPATGSRRVIRGGSWDDEARFVRAAARHAHVSALGAIGLGFRLARSP
jgi:formylglycine-generating enzyme required for sulfatase activity